MELSKCCGAPVNIGGVGLTHYYICSSCHNPCDLLPIKITSLPMHIDLLHKQKELVEKFWSDILNPTNRQNATNTMILSMVCELSELMDGYKAFPWKPEREEREYILEEITDLFHFLLELYLIWGVKDWQEVEDLYLKKRSKNIDRGEIHKTPSNDLDK